MKAIKIILFLLLGIGLGALFTWYFNPTWIVGNPTRHHMMPYGLFGGGVFVVGLLFFAGFIFYLLKQANTKNEQPYKILQQRLASGEITIEEYQKRKETIMKGGNKS